MVQTVAAAPPLAGRMPVASASAPTRTLAVRLERVVDGDTLVVRARDGKKLRIRLAAIDAPEASQTGGQAARRFLEGSLQSRSLLVRSSKTDRYKRLVGKVLADGRDVNLAMLRAGMAWYYRRFASEQSVTDRQAYDRAERGAQAARRGLWAADNPLPPWQYRQQQRRRQRAAGEAPRRRTVSYSAIPAATETFRLETAPAIGMRTSASQRSRVRRRKPLPSAPSTQATESGRSAS